MTNTEALAENIRNYLESDIDLFLTDDDYRTIIKALEQEPCEDYISRKAITDTTICEGISCNECSFNACEDGQSGCLLHERVGKLPTVQPEPKTEWIPVSERLPEINQKVLISLRNLDVDVGCNCCYRSDYIEYSNVLAWQPLPEPYNEK